MAAIETLIETALYSKLTGNAQLVALATGGVYEAQAPASTTDNYVIYQYSGGGDDNTHPRRSLNLVYRVEFISTVKGTARTGAGYIDDALHGVELTITGYSNYSCRKDDLFAQVDNVAGKQYFRRGGFYRIRAEATS